jgi:hypothetical protein
MKGLFAQKRQNSDVKEVEWRLAVSHIVVYVFASLPNILAPQPGTRRTVSVLPKVCFKPWANVIGLDAFLSEEPNDHSLVVFPSSSEKPRGMNLSVRMLNAQPA